METEKLPCRAPDLGMYGCDQEIFDRVWKRVMPAEPEYCPIVPIPSPMPVPRPMPAPVSMPTSISMPSAMSMPAMMSMPSSMSMPSTMSMPATMPMPAAMPKPSTMPMPSSMSESTIRCMPGPGPKPVSVPVTEAVSEPMEPMPVTLSEPAAAVESAPQSGAAAVSGATPCPCVHMPNPSVRQSVGDDFPPEDAVPCLGSESAPHGSQLQQFILTELEAWQLYRQLARKVTGAASRTLSALASEKHRQARRLAAAYFLISGVRYWPTDRLPMPRITAWLGTLRQRFTTEQRQESRYRTASCDTADYCLRDLYTDMADDCAQHAAMLRALLETAL